MINNHSVDVELASIFRAVFPDLNEKDITTAGSHNTESWDSIAFVTLIFSIEEIFKIKFTNDEIIQLTDYESIKRLILDKIEE